MARGRKAPKENDGANSGNESAPKKASASYVAKANLKRVEDNRIFSIGSDVTGQFPNEKLESLVKRGLVEKQ